MDNVDRPNCASGAGFDLTGVALGVAGLGLSSLYAQAGQVISIEQGGEQ